jgi:hypothetical protein
MTPVKSRSHDPHTLFLSILPRIEAHGRVQFHYVRCQQKKDDFIAEMIAISYSWFVRLLDRGKDPTTFVSALATFAAKAVGSGRRLCGQEKANDVMSPRAQQRHGFTIGPIPRFSSLTSNPFSEALSDNTQTPPDEQAIFRIDFPTWLTSLDQRNREIVEAMMMSEKTLDLATRFKISSARVSQLRREFKEDWSKFCGEVTDHATARTNT